MVKIGVVFLAFICVVDSRDYQRIRSQDLEDYRISGLSCFSNCTPASPDDVYYYLWTREYYDEPLLLTDETIDQLDITLDSKFIMHGWNEGYNTSWIEAMKDAYLRNNICNVITPDYITYTLRQSLEACCFTPSIASIVGYFIYNLQKTKGLNLKKSHLIGASLGAQLSGMVGQAIQYYTDGEKVGRITGLDPAFPGYEIAPDDMRLTPDDGDVVDIYHTNAGEYGWPTPTGTVDFYPNCGILQPQCVQETGLIGGLCSHSQSHVFFNATIYYSDIFIGVKCDNCEDFEAGKCDNNERAIVGEYVPSNARGVYYTRIGTRDVPYDPNPRANTAVGPQQNQNAAANRGNSNQGQGRNNNQRPNQRQGQRGSTNQARRVNLGRRGQSQNLVSDGDDRWQFYINYNSK
ncbi:lipase member H isoform X2 [Agrilus planipennis]|uniref:Lipase member H isoform X2 n=1 Tax=Agrilus planipennis TaxID=224129 RepID=A0A7F5RNK7_AGRPL|nr:lipase member H isoform X2 [Agrilus planipennis]